MYKLKLTGTMTLLCLCLLGCKVDSDSTLRTNGSMLFYTIKPCATMDLYVDGKFEGKLEPLDTKPATGIFKNPPAGTIFISFTASPDIHSSHTSYKKGNWTFTSDRQTFVVDDGSKLEQTMEMFDK